MEDTMVKSMEQMIHKFISQDIKEAGVFMKESSRMEFQPTSED